jgi:gluconate kinase
MASRTGHFMPATLLESQLETLEHLEDDERGVIVDANRPAETVTADAWAAVEAFLRGD